MNNVPRYIDLVIASLTGASIGIIGSIAYQSPINNKLADSLLERPPVLIVDYLKLAADALPIGATEENHQEYRNKIKQTISRYKDAGYLILPRDNLIHAPINNTLFYIKND